jgi:hypothetical protein
MTWTSIIGVDFGIVDQNAVSVLQWRAHDSCTYVAESYRLSAGVTEMAAEVRNVMDRYKPQRVVADCGGQGKAFQDEMRARHGLPIEAAEKHGKVAFISLVNDAFRQGLLKLVAPRCKDLIEELTTLPWAAPVEERREGHQTYAAGFKDHASDSLLYAFRACLAWRERPAAPVLPVGSTAWEAEQREARAKASQKKKDWWRR